MPRLFVAVWPPPAVVARLAALPREPSPGLRWTTADQWHVTLRYLGEVDGRVARRHFTSIRADSADVELGPAVERMGAGVIAVPVTGLEEIARAVHDATAGIGEPPHPEGFRGHLTLARQRRPGPHPIDGVAVTARFPVDEIALVRSELHPDGARYTTVASRSLSA